MQSRKFKQLQGMKGYHYCQLLYLYGESAMFNNVLKSLIFIQLAMAMNGKNSVG